MQITKILCDVCENSERTTERYEIRIAGRRYPVDLCDEHAAPLAELVAAHLRHEEATGGRHSPRPANRRPIMTMDEIEAMKRAGSEN